MANKLRLQDQQLSIMDSVRYWEGEISNKRVRELFGVQITQAIRILAEYHSHISDEKSTPAKEKSFDEYTRLTRGKSSIFVDTRLDLLDPLPSVFAVLHKAASEKKGAIITTIEPETIWTIFPHTIVRTSHSRHTRAWCDKQQRFADFPLSQISTAKITNQPTQMNVAADEEWNRIVRIQIASPGQPPRHIFCRACLAQYAIQDLRLSDPESLITEQILQN